VSTDLTFGSATHGPVFDTTTTMSKLLHFGVGLDDVVLRATAAPAKILGLEGIAGTLRPGANADIAILELRERGLRVPRFGRQYRNRQAPADYPPDAKGRPRSV
jgi:predicted amidohydrolase